MAIMANDGVVYCSQPIDTELESVSFMHPEGTWAESLMRNDVQLVTDCMINS